MTKETSPLEIKLAVVENTMDSPALPMDRYYLWAPVLCREENVE